MPKRPVLALLQQIIESTAEKDLAGNDDKNRQIALSCLASAVEMIEAKESFSGEDAALISNLLAGMAFLDNIIDKKQLQKLSASDARNTKTDNVYLRRLLIKRYYKGQISASIACANAVISTMDPIFKKHGISAVSAAAIKRDLSAINKKA